MFSVTPNVVIAGAVSCAVPTELAVPGVVAIKVPKLTSLNGSSLVMKLSVTLPDNARRRTPVC